MIYTILGSLLVIVVLWLLVRTGERTLDMESRFWKESTRSAVAERRKRNR
jgi:hypothetical protein